MPDGLENYGRRLFSFAVSYETFKRYAGNLPRIDPKRYVSFSAVHDGARRRLKQGMVVLAFFEDGSGPVIGRIQSAYPENPNALIRIEG